MSDEFDEFEATTARVVRVATGKVAVKLDKYGKVRETEWPLVVQYKSLRPYQKPGGRFGEEVRPTEPRDIEYGISRGVAEPWNIRKWEKSCPEEVRRLEGELAAHLESMRHEFEREKARLERAREKRLSGDGAAKRAETCKEKLVQSFVGMSEDLDVATIRKILVVHARCSAINAPGKDQVHLYVRPDVVAAADEVGLDLGAMVRTSCVWSRNHLVQNVIQHAASNPSWWELLTDEDFQDCLRRALVLEVMGA